MHEMATVLRGLPFSATDDITTKLQINPGIEIIRKILPDHNPVSLIVVTKNDAALVWAGVNQLEKDLLLYGIRLVDLKGNIYRKRRDGAYTGEVQLSVVGNKLDFIEDGKPLFGDKQDGIRYKDYNGFVLVPEL